MKPDFVGDRENAQALADSIKHYWASRGHDVKVWLQDRPWFAQGGNLRVDYDIRSDLLNGKPQRELKIIPQY